MAGIRTPLQQEDNMGAPERRFTGLFAVALVALLLVLLGALVLSRASARPVPAVATPYPLDLSLVTFASGLNGPVGIANAGPGDDRLFVVERGGRIRILQANGTVLPTPFLDISARVDASSTEEGLLGLAFHPNYAATGAFFVNYTHTSGGTRRTRISRFQVSADPNIADPNSEDILLTVVQPDDNHNAGDLLFGPDGLLYIPLGDGGGSGDASNNAQNVGLLLGKIVRIDVDAGPGSAPDCAGTGSGNYTVPTGNPLIDGAGGVCDEIWAVGLRNPWRASFDRLTGDLYIGDVGQQDWEEINVQPATSTGGENYGWRCYEGNHPYKTSGCGEIGTYTFPAFEYGHTEGCSVTGGYVYRGSQYPAMAGRYLLTDYCSGRVWDLARVGSAWQATSHAHLMAFGYAAFGEDAAGELYLANISNGIVYRVIENTELVLLSMDKRGPSWVASGDPMTYTLTVSNSGNLTATHVAITDSIPSPAYLLPGGSGVRVGDTLSWTLGSLAPTETVTRTFAVTTAQTISNYDYQATAKGGIVVVGARAVTTIVDPEHTYLPLVTRRH
jgi:uncharacterized repeat protein (TIGR01451 family)